MHLCISTDPRGSTALYFGSVCHSTPFERYRRFTSPSKRAADSQNFWRLLKTDAVYVHRWAISAPALRWRSSEREKKLSNWLAASSFFQNFRPVDLMQISSWAVALSRPIFDRSHVHASHDVLGEQRNNRPWRIARFPRCARFNAFKHETHLEKEQDRRTSCGGLANLLASRKWECLSIDLLDPRQSMCCGFQLIVTSGNMCWNVCSSLQIWYPRYYSSV